MDYSSLYNRRLSHRSGWGPLASLTLHSLLTLLFNSFIPKSVDTGRQLNIHHPVLLSGSCLSRFIGDDHKYNKQYIPRNMHMVFALLCFVVVIHWLILPYLSCLLHRHCGNISIAPVPAKQPWWIWINTSCECIMNDCITTTKQSTTKPCAYFLGYTVYNIPCNTNGYALLCNGNITLQGCCKFLQNTASGSMNQLCWIWI